MPWTMLRLAAVAMPILLSGCVVEEAPRPLPPYGDPVCTFEYAPVCAAVGGPPRTFGNACMARMEGARIIHDGECRRGPTPDRPGWPGTPPQFCTREYAPVCARRGGIVRTFPNACEARAADYRILGPGEC